MGCCAHTRRSPQRNPALLPHVTCQASRAAGAALLQVLRCCEVRRLVHPRDVPHCRTQVQEYSALLSAFLAYYAEHAALLPKLLWQQVSAQHFDGPGGEYNGGKLPFACKTIEGYIVEVGGVGRAGGVRVWGRMSGQAGRPGASCGRRVGQDLPRRAARLP